MLWSAGVDVRVLSKNYEGRTLYCKADDTIMTDSANLSLNATESKIEDIWLLSGDIGALYYFYICTNVCGYFLVNWYEAIFTRRWSNITVTFSDRFNVDRNNKTGKLRVVELSSIENDYMPWKTRATSTGQGIDGLRLDAGQAATRTLVHRISFIRAD
ncbi:hypothetical protein JG687_00007823 [Phytophthora cactorum]|uniref:Uncharacterized protein n=1 Tax=Phytophthora cactorum TaxID=29920 RepID=A0A329RVA5_9STRA|nr:hypothetical protein JG687_00007823 [Phytophthora cactorum]RAW28524.1 hypothetical protein PC110_g15097 [Phytophthora cactorum]